MNTIDKIEDAIKKFISTYQSNPYDFLYEIEIKSIIYAELKNCLKQSVKIACGVHLEDNYGDKNFINTSIVKMEYPTKKWFDIAIIDENRNYENHEIKKEITDLRNEIFWSLPIIYGIETKLFQLGDSFETKFKSFFTDLKKLESYNNKNFYGLGLFFIQSFSEKYETKIENRLKQVDLNLSENVKGKIITPRKIHCIDKE